MVRLTRIKMLTSEKEWAMKLGENLAHLRGGKLLGTGEKPRIIIQC